MSARAKAAQARTITEEASMPLPTASANILGDTLQGLPPLPGLVSGNWVLIQRADLDAWILHLEALEARYTFGGLRDDELEYIGGA
jgi:hypothetical protein